MIKQSDVVDFVSENIAELRAKNFAEDLVFPLRSSENRTTDVSDDEPVKFSFEAQEYAFVKDAPKLIRVFGRVMSQKQIVQDEDMILQLVVGKSNLIEKV